MTKRANVAAAKVAPARSRSGKHTRPRLNVRVPLDPASPEAQVWRDAAEEDCLTLGEWALEACRAWALISTRDGDAGLTDEEWQQVVSGA